MNENKARTELQAVLKMLERFYDGRNTLVYDDEDINYHSHHYTPYVTFGHIGENVQNALKAIDEQSQL